MTPAEIDNKIRYLRWQRLHQGVYATFTGRPDRQAQLWAVMLRAGPSAALSFETAAELHGLTSDASAVIHVTVPDTQRTRPIAGAKIHYSRWVDHRLHPMAQPPRTRIEDTVLDLAQASATFDDAFDWLCRAVGRRLTTSDRLSAALQQRNKARWRPELQSALGDVADGARSLLEQRYIRCVERAHGLPAARRQVQTIVNGRARYLDNLYEDAGLAVELDGLAAHPPEQRWADIRRDNAHATLGVLTLRYNWGDVTRRACSTAVEIAALLTTRGTVVELVRCGPSCRIDALAHPDESAGR
jgi:hypothetical protein